MGRSFLLRLIISGGLIAFILSQVGLARVATLLGDVSLSLFAAALGIAFLERLIFAYKWNILLATKKLKIPFIRIFKIYYVSNFIGNFLPSSVGVDVVRAYGLNRYNRNLAESVSSVFVDKILSLLALLTIPLIGAVLYYQAFEEYGILPLIGILLVGFSLLTFLLTSRRLVTLLIRKLSFIHVGLAEKAEVLYDSFSDYLAHKKTLLAVLGLSLLIQIIRVVEIYLLGLALGQELSILVYMTLVPIINLLAMLPIAVGGIGIRDGAFVYFFSQAGMGLSDAFALSVLGFILVMVLILPGGLFFLLDGFSGKRRPVASAGAPGQPPG